MVLTPDVVLINILLLQVYHCSKRGAFCFGIKVFNHLPSNIKNLSLEGKQFGFALKSFLLWIILYFGWIFWLEIN